MLAAAIERAERLRPGALRALSHSREVPVRPRVGRVPTVSVVIPCFNYGRFLAESVGSAVAQEGVEVEVIVVDDASTDDSATIAARLAGEHPSVRLVRNETNQGHVVTFNNGLAVASGEFLVRLDADDLLTPGSLARATALFDAHPNVGLVYGHPKHFATPQPPTPNTDVRGWTVWSGHDWFAHACRRGVNVITTPEAVLRMSVVAEVGGLDTRLKYAQDMEMWLRAATVADVGHVNGADQALHREHPNSMSETDGSGFEADIVERRAVFDYLFENAAKTFVDADDLHLLARKALAGQALRQICRAYERGRTAREPVEWYETFAAEVYPDYQDLSQWRALRRRRRAGTTGARLWLPFQVTAALRRLRGDLEYTRWARTGV